MSSRSISVVIPVRNEADNLGPVVAGVRRVLGADADIVVVDDGSSDESAQIAVAAGARAIRHPYGMGNGAAVKTGIRHARGEWLVLMDGDGQHDPADIPSLIGLLDCHDLVVGARARQGQASIGRALANWLYNSLASYVTQRRIPDLTSGFRAVRRRVVRPYLYLLPNTFSYPTTITLAFMRSGRSVAYVPITVHRRAGASKIRWLADGSRFVIIIMKIATLFAPLRVFLPVSIGCAVAGLVNYVYTFVTMHRFTNMSALLIMTGVVVFLLGLIAEGIADLRFDRTEDGAADDSGTMNT